MATGTPICLLVATLMLAVVGIELCGVDAYPLLQQLSMRPHYGSSIGGSHSLQSHYSQQSTKSIAQNSSPYGAQNPPYPTTSYPQDSTSLSEYLASSYSPTTCYKGATLCRFPVFPYSTLLYDLLYTSESPKSNIPSRTQHHAFYRMLTTLIPSTSIELRFACLLLYSRFLLSIYGCPPSSNSLSQLLTSWFNYVHRLSGNPMTHLPLYWTPDELKALQHPVMNTIVQRRRKLIDLNSKYKQYIQGTPQDPFAAPAIRKDQTSYCFTDFSLQSLMWSHGIVNTRMLKLSEKEIALLPAVEELKLSSELHNCKLILNSSHYANKWGIESHEHLHSNTTLYDKIESSEECPDNFLFVDYRVEGSTIRDKPEDMHSNSTLLQVSVITTKDINQGEPIILKHRPMTDAEQLLNFGYITSRNKHDELLLAISPKLLNEAATTAKIQKPFIFESFDELDYQKKIKINDLRLVPLHVSNENAADTIKRASTKDDETPTDYNPIVSFNRKELVDRRLIALVRIIMADEEEKLNLAPVESLMKWDYRISTKNERLTLRLLSALCKEVGYHLYSSPLEEERDALQTGFLPTHLTDFGTAEYEQLTPAKLTAINFRLQKKQLLEDVHIRLHKRHKSLE